VSAGLDDVRAEGKQSRRRASITCKGSERYLRWMGAHRVAKLVCRRLEVKTGRIE
jgi:hypothetical protein